MFPCNSTTQKCYLCPGVCTSCLQAAPFALSVKNLQVFLAPPDFPIINFSSMAFAAALLEEDWLVKQLVQWWDCQESASEFHSNYISCDSKFLKYPLFMPVSDIQPWYSANALLRFANLIWSNFVRYGQNTYNFHCFQPKMDEFNHINCFALLADNLGLLWSLMGFPITCLL